MPRSERRRIDEPISRRLALSSAARASLQGFVGVVLLPTLFLLPLSANAFTRMCRASVQAQGDTPDARQVYKPGFYLIGLLVLGLCSLPFGLFVAHALVAEPTLRDYLGCALAGVGSGAMLAPLAFAPLLMVRTGTLGFRAASVASFVIASRAGMVAVVARGALGGLALGLAFFAPSSILDGLAAFLATALALGVATAATAIVFAHTLRGVLAKGEIAPADAPRALLRPLMFALPAFAALALGLFVAALEPTPFHERAHPIFTGLPSGTVHVGEGAEASLPTPSGLVVRSVMHGIVIEVADGGGAGFVEVPEPGYLVDDIQHGLPAALVRAVEVDGRGAYEIVAFYAYDERDAHRIVVDHDGVRLDDGIVDRIGWRLGDNGLGLVLATFLSFGIAIALLASRRGEARLLGAPGEVRARGRAPLALEGRLSLGPGASMRLDGPALVAVGDAFLVDASGELRVRLPPGRLEVLGEIPELTPRDGDTACIVGTFELPDEGAFRSGAVPWPEGGRLLLGSRSAAAGHLADRAAHAAAPWVAISVGCAVVALLFLSSAL